MARKYSDPRYKNKPHPGRKTLPESKKRKLIAARVAPETYNYLQEEDIKLGLLIDQLVRLKKLLKPEIAEKLGRETIDFDAIESISENPYDVITEQARGLLAMIVERGSGHLTEEQLEVLNDNFTLIINNYLATFKRNKSKTDTLL